MRTQLAAAAALLAAAAPAAAGIQLSQAVIDIVPGAPTAQDIEVANDGAEVAYVAAEPSEIIGAGTPAEKRVRVSDPETGGLLVSPQKLILQPGERKLIRVAAVTARPAQDRVWRVTVKPVAGSVSAPATAIKLLVGYDALVILRPDAAQARVVGRRDGATLTLTNQGNTNAELFDGEQCATAGSSACARLPARRLYPGASWTQPLPGGAAPVRYHVSAVGTVTVQGF